tara:strand:+ start:3803 stop:4135 length:333 start_codon:yes stop_codon:yes gene_type:complete
LIINNDRPDPFNANTDGLLWDIREDQGTDRWDLVQFAIEFIVKDVQNFIGSGSGNPGDERNKDHMYGLMNLLSTLDDKDLLGILPKDNGVYLPNVCGKHRLEGFDNNARV